MSEPFRLALNADTTPLSISDTLIFKPFRERAEEAARAGFTAVNVDRNEPGLTPTKVLDISGKHGLEVASGFFQGRFHLAEEETAIFQEAEAQARFSHAIGQDCLFVSDIVSAPQRHALAGRVRPGQPFSLSANQFRQMGKTLERVAQLWKGHGIQLLYHPHVGSYVEAPHEIHLLMENLAPELVRFGPDTGHLFFGGSDPIQMIEHYFDRLGSIHVKDARSDVVRRVRRDHLDYREACRQGVWTELGSGDIDFPRLFDLLRSRGWRGWIIVETDHTHLSSALESSRASREYLRRVIGI